MLRRLWRWLCGEPKLKGVFVMYYPEGDSEAFDGRMKDNQEIAQEICASIRPGCCLVLPNSKDSYGNYLWEFRVIPDKADHILVERADDVLPRVDNEPGNSL